MECVKEGKVRSAGVSNFGVRHVGFVPRGGVGAWMDAEWSGVGGGGVVAAASGGLPGG